MKKSITRLAICGIGLGMLLSTGCAQRPLLSAADDTLKKPAMEPTAQLTGTGDSIEPALTAPVATAPAPTAAPVANAPVAAPAAPVANAPVAAPAATAVAAAPAPASAPTNTEPAPPRAAAMAKTVPTIYKYAPDASQSLGTEKQLSEYCREIAGKVYYELKQNGEKHLTSRVAVVDAVPLSDLKRETEFGRLISEYMLTDLADRGLKVTELRLGKEINILPQTGEFILSRNIGELATDAPMLDYVLVSTFTNTRKTLILQGRLVGLKSGLVETSWRYTLPLNRELLGLFHTPEQPFTIAVNGMNR